MLRAKHVDTLPHNTAVEHSSFGCAKELHLRTLLD